jgi:hypothetical protein
MTTISATHVMPITALGRRRRSSMIAAMMGQVTTVSFLSISSIAILLLVGTQGTLHLTELTLRYQAGEHERKRTTRCEFHG